MATSLTAALSTVVKEEIPQGIREMRLKIDPVWQDIIVTSTGVTREGLGRDWKFLLTYTTGLSGSYQFQTNAVMVGANLAFANTSVNQFGAGNTFPARTESTAPAFFQKDVLLKEARGNLHVPLKWMQLDEFSSSIGPAVKQIMKGTARRAAKAHAIAFHTTDATDFPVVWNLPNTGSAATLAVAIDNSDSTKSYGRPQMIENGDVVDIYNSSDTLLNTLSPWVVTLADPLNGTFTAVPLSGSDAIDPDAGSYIVLRNSRGNQPSGLRSWMKNSGTIFNSLSLTNHPEFKSLIKAESGPLTENMLNKYIGTFFDRLGTMCDLDTIITSAAVVHGYLQNEDNLARYERNGRRLEVKGGWASIDYAYQSMPFRWAISGYIEPKACYVLKLKNNIKEYVPPPTPGAGRKSQFGNEIQFLKQIGGGSDIFFFERLSDAVTDQFEAPFFRICELAPDQPQGIILTGLDEVEGLSD